MGDYLQYFQEIACIPHGSHNTKMISDYLVRFANQHGLYVRQDSLNNVVIIKDAHPSYVNHEPVILQGHMDMVAVKEQDCPIDMTSDGLDLFVDGDMMGAHKTSLGGDDGIAIAYMLDILSNDYKCPRLECIITVDEEVGMDGAKGIDISDTQATRMINIDNEVEGELIVGCAGGVRFVSTMNVVKELGEGSIFKISVEGLKGGHSGVEIDKQRGNAIKILAGELCKLVENYGIKLIDINGGTADNVIPNYCEARVMLTNEHDNPLIAQRIISLNGSDFYFGTENDIDTAILKVTSEESREMIVFDDESTRKVTEYLSKYPDGIQKMSEIIPNSVETSLNIGMIVSDDEAITVTSLVRSSIKRAKDELTYELCKLANDYGASYEMVGDYPGWEVREDSELADVMAKIYEEMYLCKPEVHAIHAGLECGMFLEKRPELECVSFGPTISDIHSAKERMSLSSAKRMFEYLLRILENM